MPVVVVFHVRNMTVEPENVAAAIVTHGKGPAYASGIRWIRIICSSGGGKRIEEGSKHAILYIRRFGGVIPAPKL